MSYYKMERGWMESAVWQDAPYSDREAWCWMIGEARYESGHISAKGLPLLVKRGQLYSSVRFMAEKFQWSTNRVLRFLEKLKKWQMIDVETETGQNLITICKYDTYQDNVRDSGDTHGDRGGDTTGDTHGDKQEEIQINSKKEKKDIPQKKSAAVFVLPDWIPEHSWKDFCEHRRKIRKPMSEGAMALTVKELDKFRQSGFSPEAILNQSIQRGWAGVFEIKGEMGNGNGNTRSANGNPGAGNKQPSKHERAKAALLQSAIDLGYAGN